MKSDERRKRQSEIQKKRWEDGVLTYLPSMGPKKGCTPWNKGLTKETNISVANGAKKMKGENNAMWKGGISAIPYGQDWSEISERIKNRDNNTCQICEKTENLCAHHIMDESINVETILNDIPLKDNRDEWLVTLCKSCHQWVETRYSYRKKPKNNTLLLMSGGIDSTVAYFMLDKPTIMYQCIGHRYMRAEFITVCKFARRNNADLILLANINLGQFEEPDANIPGRNGILISAAAYFADRIYLVAQKGEQSIPDRSPNFFKMETEFLTWMFEKPKTVDCVFPHETKQDLVKRYLSEGYPKEELLQSYSCFTPGGNRCGECTACFRTAIALDYNNILPDKFFAKDIWGWSGVQDYIKRLKSGTYEKTREEQTILVLRKRGFDI